MSKDDFLKIIRDWKFHWMMREGKNYASRAFSIDANMMHHLAQKLVDAEDTTKHDTRNNVY